VNCQYKCFVHICSTVRNFILLVTKDEESQEDRNSLVTGGDVVVPPAATIGLAVLGISKVKIKKDFVLVHAGIEEIYSAGNI
jgi:hypothetical protein